jgi:SAM-dependent methyltransferase
MASEFGKHEFPNSDADPFLKLLLDRGMYTADSLVLDVGCGTGRYALAIAKHCKSVIGVDLSPRMLDIAREQAKELGISNVEFKCLDWHTLDLDEAGYAKAFDLVFAKNTPAIQSADTFMKLTRASRKWCAMSKPARRTDPVSDELKRLVGIGEKRENGDHDILYAFELLWQNGMHPGFEYEKQQWDMRKCLDDAYGMYINRLKTYRELTPEEEEKAKKHLQLIAVNGIVSEQINTMITMMYWQIDLFKNPVGSLTSPAVSEQL